MALYRHTSAIDRSLERCVDCTVLTDGSLSPRNKNLTPSSAAVLKMRCAAPDPAGFCSDRSMRIVVLPEAPVLLEFSTSGTRSDRREVVDFNN